MSVNGCRTLAIPGRGLVEKFGDLRAVDGIDLEVLYRRR
jgi:hypothetical protein